MVCVITHVQANQGRPEVLQEIQEVPVPGTDPVYGEGGPLTKLWLDRGGDSPNRLHSPANLHEQNTWHAGYPPYQDQACPDV